MKGALKLLQAAVEHGSVSVLVKGALQVRGAGWRRRGKVWIRFGLMGAASEGAGVVVVRGGMHKAVCQCWSRGRCRLGGRVVVSRGGVDKAARHAYQGGAGGEESTSVAV